MDGRGQGSSDSACALGRRCGACGCVPAVSCDESSVDRAGPPTGTARAMVFEIMSSVRHQGVIDQSSPCSTAGAARQTSHGQAGEPWSRRPGRGCRGGGGQTWSAPSWCCCRFGEHLRGGCHGFRTRRTVRARGAGERLRGHGTWGNSAPGRPLMRVPPHEALAPPSAEQQAPPVAPLWSSPWAGSTRSGRGRLATRRRAVRGSGVRVPSAPPSGGRSGPTPGTAVVRTPSGEHAPGFRTPGARRDRRADSSRPGCGILRRAAGSPRSPWGTPSRPARA